MNFVSLPQLAEHPAIGDNGPHIVMSRQFVQLPSRFLPLTAEVIRRMDRRLYEAAASQNFESLSLLAEEQPAIVDGVTHMGDNALHIAMRCQFVMPPFGSRIDHLPRIFLPLLTQANKKRETPLHVALRAGNYQTFELCLEALMQLGERDLEQGMLPISPPEDSQNEEAPRKSLLYLAAEAGSLECVLKLLESPWSWAHESRGPKNSTALHAAIIHKHTDVWKELVCRKRELIQSKDVEGDTPLHIAVCMEDVELIGQLVEADADVAYALNNDGLSPVHVAAALGFLISFKCIHKLCPEACRRATDKGRNSLHLAVRNGRGEIVEYILSNFDDFVINEQDMYGNTPLHLAHRWRFPWMIKTLSRHRLVDRNVLNDDGLNCVEAVQLLDRKGKLSMNNTFGMYLGDVRNLKEHSRLKGLHNDIEFYESDILSNIPERVKALASSLSVVATLIVGVAFGAAFSVTSVYNSSRASHDTITRVFFKIFIIVDAISAILAIFGAFNLILAGGLTDKFFLRIKVRRSMFALQVALRLLLVALGTGLFAVVEDWSRVLAFVALVMSCLAPVLFLVWSYFQEDRFLMDTIGGPLKLIIPLFILVPLFELGRAVKKVLFNTCICCCGLTVFLWRFLSNEV